jgi:hypothetical protein
MGIRVIMQLPDLFNHDPWHDPNSWARECHVVLAPFAPYSDLVCLDNEPNLYLDGSNWWWAGEYTRWFRAVAASFRYWDKACHWKLVFPALCGNPKRNFDGWLKENAENIRECEYTAVHCYWQNKEQLVQEPYGLGYLAYHRAYPDRPLLMLEYGNSADWAGDKEKCAEYPAYVASLPDYVKAACAFILGGTEDWKQFHLTIAQADALGRLS